MKNTVLIFALIIFKFSSFGQNIGINTPVPLRTFSVSGSIVVDHSNKNFGTLDSASLVFGASPLKVRLSSNKNALMENPEGLDFWTNNLKRMAIAPNGNIGIGIQSPLARLQVASSADVSLLSHGALLLGSVAGSNLAFDNNEIQARNNGTASSLYLQNNGGRLQVGATSDSRILFDGVNIQSYFNNTNSELIINGLDGGKVRLGGNLDFANTKLHISSGVDAGLTPAQSGYMMIGPSNAENLVFDNNEILARNNGVASTLFLARDGSKIQLGNGAEASGTKLHITTGNDVGLSDAQSGHLMLGSQAATNMIFDQNEIQARNNGATSPLFIQSSGGNIALGAITPTSQLHMTGDLTMQSTTPTVQLKNLAGTNMGFMDLSSNDVRTGTNADNNTGNYIIRTNGANRIYVNPTGQVSIGISTPATGYMLSVNGRAMVEELKVQLSGNWPDYVFADQYKLKSFQELRKFIAENKHLPNIPAASEIEKSGLEIGEMQRKMMEKIEELTLYVLDLEQKISDLKK